ncbi:5-oxoprolinase subunit PxpB [Marinobacter fonticola]|uniref:5-oxoprolinase subunit PxpB n=1 Tax=Marinobacter fonticola TaxID=2603215 RepID=UPI001D0D9784|nr:5-oxoprolinase subunit PxpB [Marinobacter fonticola]
MIVEAVGENGLLIRFGEEMDEALTPYILHVRNAIAAQLGHWVTDLIPAYTTLLCLYDVRKVDFRRMRNAVQAVVNEAADPASDIDGTGRLVELPVYYAAEVGADLQAVAQRAELSIEETIERHSQRTYRVFAMGFSPGFAFMGSVDPHIATPRKDTPRDRVPAGSVGIANRQTAVYPSVSPGGWNLIGRCPYRLFSMDTLSLLQTGDRVRFRPIDRDAFLDAGGEL